MFIEKNICCGCGACVNVCPQNCINMVIDYEGFSYPKIDKNNCINCGLCKSKCPAIKINNKKEIMPNAYAVKAKDLELRFVSSSGGAFSIIADYVLKNRGVVCGAAITSDCKSVEHIIIDKKNDLYKLRSSKYAQSNIGLVYRQINSLLKSDRIVLFSGTPCQIEGLNSFLGKKYDNLITTEIICHGVPSPELFKKYISWQELRKGAKIINVNFRHKKLGWYNYISRFENSNHKIFFSTLREEPFMQMYLRNYCIRPSCYNCYSKNFKPRADFTLGDFWGVKEIMPEFYDDKGVSLILVHNDKAKNIFENIKNEIEFKETDCMAAIKYNICMLKSVKKPKERDTFFEDMNKYDFGVLSKKYAYVKIKQRIKNRLEMFGFLKIVKRLYRLLIRKK